ARARGFVPFHQGGRLVEAEMGRVRLVTQRVDDREIEACEGGDAHRRQVDEVARVGDRAEPVAERGDVAVVLREGRDRDRTALPANLDRGSSDDAMLVEDRRVDAAAPPPEGGAQTPAP